MEQDVISEIKKRINIVDLISNYVTLKKRGKSYIGLCPFHNEKTGSFNVNADKGFYKCFGCGESGDIFTFVQKYENVDFYDALKILAEKAGVEITVSQQEKNKKSEKDEIYTANGYAVNFYKNFLKSSPEALSYLSRRGVSPEIAEKFSLGFSPNEWNKLTGLLRSKQIKDEIGIKAGLLRSSDKNTVYDVFRNRVMYPIFTSMGKPIGFGGRNMGGEEPKYLNTPETPVFNKGKEFYGLNFAKESISKKDQAIIVEGYMDVIACHSHGVENAIAVLGTALTKDHIEKITRYTKNIVLCFDADNAGIKAALRSGDLFLYEGITPKVATTPKGEDPDSFLLNNDTSKFYEIIDNAVGLLDFEINVAISSFDLSDNSQKALALSEACKIVAKEPNTFRREVLVSNLVYLHPNSFSSSAELEIRNEVNKYIKSRGQAQTNSAINNKAKYDKYTMVQRIILSGVCGGIYDLDVFDTLEERDFDIGLNRELFVLIKNKYEQNQAPTYSYLENSMRDKNLVSEFIDLINMDEKLFNHPIKDLVDLLLVKRNISNISRKKELEKKLSDGTLTKEEQAELLTIIRGR